MDTHCVHFEVGTGLILEVNEELPSNGPCHVPWAVSRRPIIAETMVLSWTCRCERCGGPSGHCDRFLSEYVDFPCQYYSTSVTF